jgi:hypothetical protein
MTKTTSKMICRLKPHLTFNAACRIRIASKTDKQTLSACSRFCGQIFSTLSSRAILHLHWTGSKTVHNPLNIDLSVSSSTHSTSSPFLVLQLLQLHHVQSTRYSISLQPSNQALTSTAPLVSSRRDHRGCTLADSVVCSYPLYGG